MTELENTLARLKELARVGVKFGDPIGKDALAVCTALERLLASNRRLAEEWRESSLPRMKPRAEELDSATRKAVGE